MKTIRQRFNEVREQHPEWGDIPVFEECLLKTDKDSSIRRAFNALVDKSEYLPSEREGLLGWLCDTKGEKPSVIEKI